jgi:hypothetical protein
MNTLLCLILFLLTPVLAFADGVANTFTLHPQDKIVGHGVFCGVLSNATVVQDMATGEIFLVDEANPNNRVLLTIPLSYGTGLKVRKVIDTNGDGCSDFLIENRLGASFDIWYLRGTHVVRMNKLPLRDFFASSLIESDFRTNGKPSFFVTNKTTGEIVSYVSDGLAWNASTLHPAGTHPGLIPLAVGDFHRNGQPEIVFFNPAGPPQGRFVVVGYNIHAGFVRDEGVERVVNEALSEFVQNLNQHGEWKVTVVHDSSGRYEPGYLLSLKLGLL